MVDNQWRLKSQEPIVSLVKKNTDYTTSAQIDILNSLSEKSSLDK